MNTYERDYRKLLVSVLRDGTEKADRTGVGNICCFNKSLTINLAEGFPILTAKKIFFDKALHEYRWMIDGLTTLTYLHQHGIKWWDEFADSKGNLGKTYGYQIRSFNGEIDQLDYVHRKIRENSRKAHITLWNPSELQQTILPPCYVGFTFMRVNNVLNMSIQFRSSDLFLGLPYDVCVGALMLKDIARFNELTPGYLGIQITDAHIYNNHINQVKLYLSRNPDNDLPLSLRTEDGLYKLLDYNPQSIIKAKLNN